MTPNSVHHGLAERLRSVRQAVLDEAFHATPNRYKGRRPEPQALPTAVWINPPPPPETIKPTPPQPCAASSWQTVAQSHWHVSIRESRREVEILRARLRCDDEVQSPRPTKARAKGVKKRGLGTCAACSQRSKRKVRSLLLMLNVTLSARALWLLGAPPPEVVKLVVAKVCQFKPPFGRLVPPWFEVCPG